MNLQHVSLRCKLNCSSLLGLSRDMAIRGQRIRDIWRLGNKSWWCEVGGWVHFNSYHFKSLNFISFLWSGCHVIYCVEAPRQNQQFSIFWEKKKEQHTSYNTFLKIKGLDNRKQQRWMIAGKANLTKDSYRPGKASKRSKLTILQCFLFLDSCHCFFHC